MMENLFKEMRAYARKNDLPILRPGEVPLLENILRQARPRNVLEIGTCIGYSALHMAPFLGEKGQLVSLEIDPERVRLARSFIQRSPYQAVIEVKAGDASSLIQQLAGPWDFVFLDGPKGQYLRQVQLLLPKLLPGALLVADNMDYHDMLYLPGQLPHKHRTAVTRLRQFLALMNEETKFKHVFFENGDGLLVAQWKG